MKGLYLTLVKVLLLSVCIDAQNYFSLLNKAPLVAGLGVQANPELNVTVDGFYPISLVDKHIEGMGLVAQVNLPLFSQKGFDFDFRLGAGVMLPLKGKFKAISGLSWNMSRTADINGQYFYSGFKLDFFPGIYGEKWVLAPHLSINYQPWLHLQHNQYAKHAFAGLYSSGNGTRQAPEDGWFLQHNLVFQTGIGVAYFKPEWNISLVAGYQHQANRLALKALPDLGILPFYGGLNMGYSLGNFKRISN